MKLNNPSSSISEIEYPQSSLPYESDDSTGTKSDSSFLVNSITKSPIRVPSPTTTSATSSSSYGSDDLNKSVSQVVQKRDKKHGQAPLHIAIRKGDLEVFRAIMKLESVKNLINSVDHNGNTPLHFAASNKNKHKVIMTKTLLKLGANCEAINNNGLTPLGVHLLTLKEDKLGLPSILLEHGADPTLYISGESLLHIVLKKNLPNLATLLVKFGASLTCLDSDHVMPCDLVQRPLLIKMISHIRFASKHVNPRDRNQCMKCNGGPFVDLRKTQHGVKKLIRNVLHPIKLVEYGNCYHCSMIFCMDCLNHPLNEQTLPNTFNRIDHPTNKPRKVCTTCFNVLRVRHSKELRSANFFARSLGFEADKY